jgi:hypothetical protein
MVRYFGEAEHQPMPDMLLPVNWSEVRGLLRSGGPPAGAPVEWAGLREIVDKMSLSHYSRLGDLPAADGAQLRSEKRDNRNRLTVQRHELNFIAFAISMDQDDGTDISLF